MYALMMNAIAFFSLLISASAFVSPTGSIAGFRGTTAARSSTTSSGARGMLMACRSNSKKEKRQRNRENMRKFNKRGISRKKIVRIQNQERAAEAESKFLANLFTTGMDDWEIVDIFNEP